MKRRTFMGISAIVKNFSMVTAGAAFIALGVVGFPATAITLNQGYDPGLESGQSHPNSNSATAAFDSVAATLGSVNVLDFENLTTGIYSTLSIAPGVTATWLNPNSSAQSISDGTYSLLGHNITSGGSKFLSVGPDNPFNPVSLTFSFENPIQTWGAYFTGVQGIRGKYFVEFTDGSSQSLSLAENDDGGVQFLGFTSAGKSISSITIAGQADSSGYMGDIIGLDDMRYVFAPSEPTQSVPEPASVLSLLVFGAVGASSMLKRKQETKA